MTGHDLAKLLIEQELIELSTVLRASDIVASRPYDVDSGEATIIWAARLNVGSSSLTGIDVWVKGVRAWGELVAEDGTYSEFDIVYPDTGRAVPDDADAYDLVDAVGDNWAVEVNGELSMPRRPGELQIDFDRKRLIVTFE